MTSSETTFNDEELIARLRDAPADGLGTENLCLEAADRIEQLKHRLFQCASDLQIYMDAFAVSEAKLSICEKYRDAYDEMGRIGTQAVRDLEAKLAKAEAGLLAIAKRDEQMIWGEDYEVEEAFKDMRDIALATLAEIKGESHE